MVESDVGAMGGTVAHEFMVPVNTAGGEAVILDCDRCDYTANIEKAKLPPVEPVRFKEKRHSTNISPKNNSRPRPIQNEKLEPAVNHQKNSASQREWLVTEEVPEYVIHTGEISFDITLPETEILRKVRL